MKITSVTTSVVDFSQGFSWGNVRPLEVIGVMLRIKTDSGAEGFSGAWTGPLPAAGTAKLVDEMAHTHLLDADPMARAQLLGRLSQAVRVGLPLPVVGIIDCALWDLVGRVLGQPISVLLGRQRDRIKACASAPAVDDEVQCEEMVAAILEQGFGAIKLHVCNDLDKDLAVLRAARYAAGNDVELMMDAMGLYDRSSAQRLGQEMDELGYRWFEDPLAETDLQGWMELRGALATPLAGVDSVRHTVRDYSNAMAMSPFDILRMDGARNGITELFDLAKLARAQGLACEAHSFGPVMAQAANIQVAMAVDNGSFFELPVPIGGLDNGALGGFPLDADGCVVAPEGPGNGLQLDEAALRTMQVA
ncbi:MAG: hypothetical protein K0U93_29295 [Gammaproteobacteria bacterium]|nr:hypothetical protein [Gammaproteobacteria bacterium]